MNIKTILRLFKKEETREDKILKSCGCVCYCIDCNEPLNDDSHCETLEDGLYEYTCVKCNIKSKFHFGIAPVPIYIK